MIIYKSRFCRITRIVSFVLIVLAIFTGCGKQNDMGADQADTQSNEFTNQESVSESETVIESETAIESEKKQFLACASEYDPENAEYISAEYYSVAEYRIGDEPILNMSQITIRPRENIKLSVKVLAENPEKVSYKWFAVYGEGDDLTFTADDSANQNHYIIENQDYKKRTYQCKVSDETGNIRYVNFEVTVDNGFSAIAGGYDTDEVTIPMKVGEIVNLEVIAYAYDSSGINYEWFSGSSDQDHHRNIADSNSNIITTEPVTEDITYICLVTDRYMYQQPVAFHLNLIE